MQNDDAIVRPFTLFAGQIGKTAVIVSNEGDLRTLCDLLQISPDSGRQFLMSRLYVADSRAGSPEDRLALLGPVVGAPYAVMMAETLIASGAEDLIFFGWGGSLSGQVHTGDILLPTRAFADEGLSRHYLPEKTSVGKGIEIVSAPSPELLTEIKKGFAQADIVCHEGPVWTTDAIFRETPDKVRKYQRKTALAVDMEVSALFSVAAFRGIQAAAVLVVSDELFDLTWQPGFADKRFIKARKDVTAVISQMCGGAL